MEQSLYLVTLISTALVLAAAFSSLIAFRFGAPLLLLFLGIGLLSGEDGLGLDFNNAQVAYTMGVLALAVILFDSGFGTPLTELKHAAMPALSLATVGVLITTIVFGVAAFYLTHLSWLESLLLGAAVASTDAAAVFFLIRAGNLNLRDRVRSTLEVESGANDPIAIFLTLTLVEIISLGHNPDAEILILDFVVGFIKHMAIGGVVGYAGGLAISRLVERIHLDAGLVPIFVLTLSLMVFALAGAIGGSGFLAVYLAGLVAGNSQLRLTAQLKRFQDGVSWLAQIIMFLMLGLFATPSQFPAIMLISIVLGLFLIFIARPVAVWLCLLPFNIPRAETAFMSWVGLRGAVSILLAITPLLTGMEHGRDIFNMAFIIVLVSLVVQGWTVGPLARRLGLIVPVRLGPLEKVELELPGSAHHELLSYTVVPGSPVARGGRIPRWARPSLVVREGRSFKFQDAGRLQEGDHVYIFVSHRYPRLLDRLFASRMAVDPEDEEFYGAFPVDPKRPASDLEAAYDLGLSDAQMKLTIEQLVVEGLGGRVEYADRLTVGPIELIVRDIDEKGRPTELGLSFEPNTPQANIPFFLSGGEMWNHIVRLFRRPAKPNTAQIVTMSEEAPPPQPQPPL